MTTRILILCPHNAAKSVVAAAYLKREASELGLDLQVDTAGTHPDPAVLPVVRERLESEGLAVDSTPRVVADTDLAVADRVVNIGCDRSELPTERSIDDWAIPDFSVDPEAAFDALTAHVSVLARELTAIDQAERSRAMNP